MLKKEQRDEILRIIPEIPFASWLQLICYLESIAEREGWQMVPVEPTEAILDVLYDNGIDEHDEYLRNVYRAMLAAASKLGGSNE